MLFFKKAIPEIFIDKIDDLLMVNCFVKNIPVSKIQCIEDSNTILISDIFHYKENIDYNKGYGSLMMDKLISYSIENDYTYIHGNLSNVDINHKEMLHHFYGKFGFTIIEYPETKNYFYGKIQKTITKVNN